MALQIIKKLNGNVWIFDSNTGTLKISMSPDIADIRCVNEQVKISERNGNEEFIDPFEVQSLEIEPNPATFFSGDCNFLLTLLATDFFYCCGSGGTPQPTQKMRYGSFYDTTIQAPASGVNVPIQFNSTDFVNTNGVSITNDGLLRPNLITFNSNGTYNIQFSLQLFRITGGSDANVFIWLRKRVGMLSIDIPYTNTRLVMGNNLEYLVASWNFFTNINDFNTEKIQLMWYHDANIELLYQSSPIIGQPDIPSVILTVNQIAQF